MHGDQSDCGYWVKKELSADHPYANQTINYWPSVF